MFTHYKMTRFNWTEWALLLLVVLKVCNVISRDQRRELRKNDSSQDDADGNGASFYLGRGSKEDSVETLLQRTYWSAYIRKRTTYWQRAFIVALMSVVLIVLLIRRDTPSIADVALTGIVIFACVYMVTNFFYIHGDIYNDANIRSNIRLIAGKLGSPVDLEQIPPLPTSDPTDRLDVM